MRPLIALVSSAVILLGVHFYLRFAEGLRAKPVEAIETVAAEGKYAAEITLTFDAQADEFALEPTSVIFRQQSKTLLEKTGLVQAGEALRVDAIENVVEGRNEFYVECVPRSSDQPIARAVRVRLLRDGRVVSETTLWSEPGQTPRGVVVLDVPASKKADGEDHEHR